MSMLVVCVLRSGGHFTPEWVEALEEGLKRHTPSADLVCLTDMFIGWHTVPLATELPGWWAKLEIMRPGLFLPSERVLYLDLDTVVVGDVSEFELTKWNDRTLVLSDLYDPTNMASGILSFHGDALRHVWDDFSRDPARIMQQHHRRMDYYLRRFLNDERRLQARFPGRIVSYKADIRGRREPFEEDVVIPERASLVCFHGRPTPADLDPDDPVRKEWGR